MLLLNFSFSPPRLSYSDSTRSDHHIRGLFHDGSKPEVSLSCIRPGKYSVKPPQLQGNSQLFILTCAGFVVVSDNNKECIVYSSISLCHKARIDNVSTCASEICSQTREQLRYRLSNRDTLSSASEGNVRF